MATLFEYAIIRNPKPRKDAAGNDTTEKAEILLAPQTVLAASDKEVAMLAARAIPEDKLDKLDEIEVLVRPFA